MGFEGAIRLMRVTAVLVSLAVAGPAAAVEPDEILPDAKLEARARALSVDLRCLDCEQSVYRYADDRSSQCL